MFLIIPAFFVLVIVLIIVGSIQAKKRREGLAAFARQSGLRYNPNKDYSFDERYPFFNELRHGSRRYAFNIMTGDYDGRSIVAFDYHYETTSRDSDGDRKTTSHYFSAVIFQSTLRINGLTIRPEGVFDRMKRLFGFDDIDFESAEFSRQFHVTSADRAVAYDVVQPETMEFMLASPRFVLHFERGLVMVMRAGRFEPHDFHAAMRLVDGVLDRVPRSAREHLEAQV